AFELWVEVWIYHPFLAGEPIHGLFLAQAFDRPFAHDSPIRFPGPTCDGDRLRIPVGDPDLIDLLAEADIRRPAAELCAARNKKCRHALPSLLRRGIAARP